MDELFEKYPYLLELKNRYILVLKDQYDKYMSSGLIDVNGISVSPLFLSDLFNNPEYSLYLDKLHNKEIDQISCRFIINGDISGSINLNMVQIIKCVQYCVNCNIIKLNPAAILKYNELLSLVSLDHFIDSYSNINYNTLLDKKAFTIPVKYMLAFLQLPQDEYDEILSSSSFINGIPKEYFLYAIVKFFKSSKIFDNYLVPETFTERCKSIASSSIVDIEFINKHLETKDDNLEKTIINEELENDILKDMPSDLTILEQAIYIYIKMCKILTYDDEFYAANQSGQIARNHENIDNISNITSDNNRVVCYEFNQIFAKLLNKLGICYESNTKLINGFGGGHANLEFRVGKFIIMADSVTSILQGDIMRSKIMEPLNGLICKNNNSQTQAEFLSILNKIYELINSKETNNTPSLPSSFEEAMAEYNSVSSNNIAVSIEEKFDILIRKVNDANLLGIDALSYMLHLRKIIFNELERQDNISITIIKNNITMDDNRELISSAIITINGDSMNSDALSNIYYLYVPLRPMVLLTHDELVEKFKTGELGYIKDDNNIIPGLVDEEVRR